MQLSVKNKSIELGIYTFGAILPNPYTNHTITAKQRIHEIISAAQLADEAGLDVFGLGEHHRLDFAVSATSVVLSAIAQTTNKIRLTSASTVLSTTDPVRLFEDIATLDLISNGRAEIIAGRGAFTESYPLFGHDLKDSKDLFEEKLKLLIEINKNEKVTWNGKFRSSLHDAQISPRPQQTEIPIWVGVGSNLESATKAGKHGQGLALVILGGYPSRVQPIIEAYRRAGKEAGFHSDDLKISISCHGYITSDFLQAQNEFYGYYSNYYKYFMSKNGSDVLLIDDYKHLVRPETALLVGDPELIIEKILKQYEMFRNDRFMIHLDIRGIPYTKLARAIELLATRVAPALRNELS